MICVENDGSTIYIFGRTNQKPYVKKAKFVPYFYCEDPTGEFVSISGVKLARKIVSSPEEVAKIRGKFKHYEADVTFTNRYLVDEVDVIDKEPIRKCYLDIEIDCIKGFPSVEMANNKILSVTCYDSFLNKYVSFLLGSEKKTLRDNGWSVYEEPDEKTLLADFMEFITSTNPDMIIAWNGDGFDFPYLIKRIENVGLNPNDLSRMNKTYLRETECRVKGRIMFDLLYGYKKITQGQKESYALEYTSQRELGEGKEKHPYDIKDFYYKDRDLFLQYNKKDVELMVKLDDKLKIIEFFDEIRRFAKCNFNDVFMNSKIVDSLVLSEARKRSVILPSKHKIEDNKFDGAFVFKPTSGLYENVAVLDMKSLYPSIMISFNLGYETLIPKPTENCINIDGMFFYSKEQSLIKDIIKGLLIERAKLKKQMKDMDFGDFEYKSLDLRQYAVKVIANSIYGVIGYPGFRLFNSRVAETVTYLGRRVIKYVIDFVQSRGFEVIYSDTDSIFIKLGERDIEDVKILKEELNASFTEFLSQFNIDDHILEIEFEKVFETILFTGAKKRYTGKLKWKDGKFTDKILITGFEARRSDTPEIGRNFQKKLFELILNKKSKSEVLIFVDGFKDRIRTECSPEEIALPIGLSKDMSSYKNVPIHVRAVNNANKFHNANYCAGDKIKYIYIKCGACGDNVIAFKEKLWPGYKIDYEKMIDRIVEKKIEPIFDALNWNTKSRSLMEFM